MQPLVSILIPAFNAGRWIGATLRSALDQTWPNTEIIVVDDGSSDATVAIARRFTAPRLTVICQANQGAAAARNTAFAHCRGDYIQWLDADDLLAPDKISRQLAAAAEHPDARTLYSGAWGRFYYRVDKAWFAPSPLWEDLTPAEWLRRKMDSNCFMQTAAWLVSRELSLAAGPWDTRLLGDDDGEYFCRVILACNRVRFVPESRTLYRQTAGNRLSLVHGSRKKLEAELLSIQLHVACLMKLEDSARTRSACLQFLQTSLASFYPESPDLMERLSELAASLGGRLPPPQLRPKFAWIGSLFGVTFAKRIQVLLPRLKQALQIAWDHAMDRLPRSPRPIPAYPPESPSP